MAVDRVDDAARGREALAHIHRQRGPGHVRAGGAVERREGRGRIFAGGRNQQRLLVEGHIDAAGVQDGTAQVVHHALAGQRKGPAVEVDRPFHREAAQAGHIAPRKVAPPLRPHMHQGRIERAAGLLEPADAGVAHRQQTRRQGTARLEDKTPIARRPLAHRQLGHRGLAIGQGQRARPFGADRPEGSVHGLAAAEDQGHVGVWTVGDDKLEVIETAHTIQRQTTGVDDQPPARKVIDIERSAIETIPLGAAYKVIDIHIPAGLMKKSGGFNRHPVGYAHRPALHAVKPLASGVAAEAHLVDAVMTATVQDLPAAFLANV